MTAQTPETLHDVWGERFNAGDLDGLLEMYDPNAVLMVQPGQTVLGLSAIRDAITGFLALKGTFAHTFQTALQSGDTALIFSRWTLSGQSPAGPISLSGQTSDVARRQPDGRWLIVIDNPWGGQGTDAA
jgi:ketosteroid isomerase-like protein